jgi:GT2 family glycosyltransferase
VRAVLANPTPTSPARTGALSEDSSKHISVVIVTHNGLVFTKLCLTSLLANTDYANYEVVVVDNGSTDGTPAFLREVASREPRVRVVFNPDNRGFARANNQGLAVATGDRLVLLNNDTLVPRGWLASLVQHLDEPTIGLVGPVTNRAGNEAQIDAPYRTYGEFVRFARSHAAAHHGPLCDIRTVIMFCAALRREVYEEIGPLDERFETGLFEDDDYAMRARAAGYRVVCAEDVFIHHFGQGSIGELAATGRYGELFHANRRRFEEKWGVTWSPHERRQEASYEELRERIRQIVDDVVPGGSTVAVVSKGDDALLEMGNRQGWHFPQFADGLYAGYHPRNGADAITLLEAVRARGADYLVIPSLAFWWLHHYDGFHQHLKGHHRVVAFDESVCMVVALSGS